MYGWLWSHLPGPAWLRVLILAVAAAAVVYVCFEWVFPAVESLLPINDVDYQTSQAADTSQAPDAAPAG